MITKEAIKKELDFCMQLREQEGGCSFNKSTKCEQCASISILWKLYSEEVLDGQKLSFNERKNKLK